MDYMLFTYPNCQKCAELKRYLAEIELEGQEYNLTFKESKLKIREFLDVIKRDDKGAIPMPTLLLREKEGIVAVLNNREELEKWLRSRD